MTTETEVKPLTAEEVVKIVEEVLEKRERGTKSRSAQRESEPATVVLDADELAQKIGRHVEAALDRHAAKQAEARAKAEAEKKPEAEKKAAQRKGFFDF
jgi:hypothetical protein